MSCFLDTICYSSVADNQIGATYDENMRYSMTTEPSNRQIKNSPYRCGKFSPVVKTSLFILVN